MKVIGKWSKNKGNLLVNMPKMRKVGYKLYPYKSQYLGDPEDPVLPLEVEEDIYKMFKIKVKLISKSSRGGDIMEV